MREVLGELRYTVDQYRGGTENILSVERIRI